MKDNRLVCICGHPFTQMGNLVNHYINKHAYSSQTVAKFGDLIGRDKDGDR